MHIRSTGFLEKGMLEVVYKIKRDQLLYFEGIDVKLIFSKFANLDSGNNCELEIVLVAYKNDQIEREDRKAKAKQRRNKKQRLKRMKNKDETCQQTIAETFFFPPTSRFGFGLAFFPVTAGSSRQRTNNKALSSSPVSCSGLGSAFFLVAASSLVTARSSSSGLSASGPLTSRSSLAFSPVSVKLFYPISRFFWNVHPVWLSL